MEEWEIQREKEKRLRELLGEGEARPAPIIPINKKQKAPDGLTPLQIGIFYYARDNNIRSALSGEKAEEIIARIYFEDNLSVAAIAEYFKYLQALEPTTNVADVVRSVLRIDNTIDCESCTGRNELDEVSVVKILGKRRALCRMHYRECIGPNGQQKAPVMAPAVEIPEAPTTIITTDARTIKGEGFFKRLMAKAHELKDVDAETAIEEMAKFGKSEARQQRRP